MKVGRKPLKKNIKNKVVDMKIKGKTEKEILAIIPTISPSTVQNITKVNRDLIERSKQKYIKLINKAIGGDTKQAEVLADVLNAETDIYNFKGECVGSRPDHKVRLDAIKYIDKLKGREQPSIKLSQTNNYIGKELDKYLK